MRTPLVTFLLLFTVSSALGQTVVDIEAKYGKSLPVYSVSEHIWMSPDYAADGQVCRMRFYPKRISAKANNGTQDLPFDELHDVLNELVPLETRGNKKETFSMSPTGGGAAWTTYDYENVSFMFSASFPILPYDGVIFRRGEFAFTIPPGEIVPEPKNPYPSKDDFALSADAKTEIVTVRWTARKCASQ